MKLNKTFITKLILILILLLILIIPAFSQTKEIKRFGLFVGANDGGHERDLLKFATSDASQVAKLLEKMGGIAKNDQILILNPDRLQLNEGFDKVDALIKASKNKGQRTELIVYYSGHSNEDGLLLGNKLYSYQHLKDHFKKIAPDMLIAILDSCSSGSFTRFKGGKQKPPFLVQVGNDKIKGHAILTSASENEAAQESDKIAGSYFTHYLVSGLRGGADMSGDGIVTLNEAYQFAFNETLQKTEKSKAGAQHPSYDIKLTGSGEVVLTDLRLTSAELLLAENLEGRIFVRDQYKNLVVELEKIPGKPLLLGLEPGQYNVTLQRPVRYGQSQITLSQDEKKELLISDFVFYASEDAVARGDKPIENYDPSFSGYRHVPVTFSLLPSVSTSGKFTGSNVKTNLSLNLLSGFNAKVHGVELGFFGGNINGEEVKGLQYGTFFNLDNGELDGIQATLGLNFVKKRLRGWQMAGAMNMVWEEMYGIQTAYFVNYAGTLRGLQIGLLNIGLDTKGCQIGLVNFSKETKGCMIGLVNIADKVDGATIGALNLVRKGRHNLDIWADDTQPFNIGTKLGTKQFYTLLKFGGDPFGVSKSISPGFGIGGFYSLSERIGMHLEWITNYIYYTGMGDDKQENFLFKFRFGPTWQLNNKLAFFAGPCLNYYSSKTNNGASLVINGIPSIYGSHIEDNFIDGTHDENNFRVWPGFYAGLQFF
ncbi:MAG: caspase family protein [Pseudomonadota bacterium]